MNWQRLLIFLVAIVGAAMLSGCSGPLQRERQLLFAPEALNVPTTRPAVAAQGFGSNLQSDVLGAPSQYQAQATVLGLLGSCSDLLLADAPGLRFSQAYSRLEACARVCTFDGAAAAANTALTATPLTVAPHGAVMLKRGP